MLLGIAYDDKHHYIGNEAYKSKLEDWIQAFENDQKTKWVRFELDESYYDPRYDEVEVEPFVCLGKIARLREPDWLSFLTAKKNQGEEVVVYDEYDYFDLLKTDTTWERKARKEAIDVLKDKLDELTRPRKKRVFTVEYN